MEAIEELNVKLQPLADRIVKTIELGARNSLIQGHYAKAPIAQLTDMVLERAAAMAVSDIHFEPREKELFIRFRIDGRLRLMCRLPGALNAYLISYLKLMTGMDIAEKRLPQDGSVLYGEKHLDIRASSIPTVEGEKVVLRLLGSAGRLMTLDQMGFSVENLTKFKQLIQSAGGIITITGPVNSGKSTLLYAVLNHLNKSDINIVTVEDPVEMKLPGVNQMQVNQKSGMTFAVGLKAVLRQDPDVVMVGEIRDEVTAQEAVRAALTGHLVLTTLHTSDASGVPARLIDMGVKPSMLAITLLAGTAQRLVRRICPHCAEEYMPEANSLEAVMLGSRFHSGIKLKRGRGCSRCGNSGYSGRTALHEIMAVNDGIKTLIARGEAGLKLKRLLRMNGMKTMQDDARAKILDGTTTAQEAWRVLNGIG